MGEGGKIKYVFTNNEYAFIGILMPSCLPVSCVIIS